MADCEQPTRTLAKLRFRQFQRFILSRLTVGAQIRHGNPPFLRLTAEFERSEKPATSRDDQLTLSYGLFGGGSGASESHSVTCTAAIDGTFLYRVEPPNFPGPEFAPGTFVSFSVTAKNQYGDYAEASCQLDAEGRITNFKRGESGLGMSP
jgi:hypothetical protein